MLKRLALAIICFASTVAVAATTTHDNYAKTSTITGERVRLEGVSGGFFDPVFAHAWLLAVVPDASTTALVCVRVYFHSGNGWAFFSSATDNNGTSLPVTVLNQQVEYGSTINEQFNVEITPQYLLQHMSDGIDFKVYGKHREMVVRIPPAALQEFFPSFDQVATASRTRQMTSTLATSTNRVRLGVNYAPVDANLAKVAGMKLPAGVVVIDVATASVAQTAGLKRGDIILSLNGAAVPSSATGLAEVLATVSPGQEVSLSVWRMDREETVTLKF
jgi:hypothetical protein